MNLVKNNTFETNSSSIHSIVIPRNVNSYPNGDTFTFTPGNYGCEFAQYNFANYLYTAIICFDEYGEGVSRNYWEEKLSNILNTYYKNIVFEEPLKWSLGDDVYYECGIDHMDEMKDLLDTLDKDDELLLNSLMAGVVYTGNDNIYEDEDIFREAISKCENDEENYFVYHKGN